MSDEMRGEELEWRLLDRYFAGECTLAERATVDTWVSHGDQRAETLERLRQVWAEAGAAESDLYDIDVAWSGVGAQVTAEPADLKLVRPHRVIPRSRMRSMISRPWSAARGIAFGMVMIVGVIVAFVFQPGLLSRADAVHHYVTTRGEQTTLTLSDGTRVMLAPASRLGVPADYATKGRTVTLEGEAFLSVVHDPAHPFSVRAGGAIIRDVGTTFDVRAYTDDRIVRIAVTQGEVEVGGTAVRMGNVAAIDHGSVTVTSGRNVAMLTSWTHGTLVFEDVPLRDVAADLTRWFGLPVKVEDSALSNRRIVATFSATASLENLLASLAPTVPAQVVPAHGGFLLIPLAHSDKP